jgi:hypothetical protein
MASRNDLARAADHLREQGPEYASVVRLLDAEVAKRDKRADARGRRHTDATAQRSLLEPPSR